MKTYKKKIAYDQTRPKTRRIMKHSLVIAAMLAIVISPESTSANNNLTHFEFRPSPLRESLTQQIVNQTMQDTSGNIWFVTQEGLNKYNGHEVENYRYSLTNPDSLSHDSISAIAQDTEGRLWIGTRGGGLDQYDYINNNFKNISSSGNTKKSILSNEITTIFADRKNNLWIGYNNSFSRMNADRMEFYHYKPDNESASDLGEITTFAEDHQGTIWVAGSNGGIYTVTDASQKGAQLSIKLASELKSTKATKILVSSKSEIWIATPNNGILIYKTEDEKHIKPEKKLELNSKIRSRHISDIYEDSENNIWIATLDGIHLVNAERTEIKTFTSENSNLTASRTYSIYQSQEGKFWIGNVLGLYSATRLIFSKHDSTNSNLSNDSVNSFATTEGEILWVGTDDGLNWKSPQHNNFQWINEFTEPSIPDPTVMSLFGDGSTLWVGTFSSGLIKLELDKQTAKTFRHDPSNSKSLPENGVTAISKSSQGDILVGTYGGGLAILRQKTGDFKVFQNDPSKTNSLSSNKVIAIQQDSLGQIWVGTEDGLNKVDLSTGEIDRIYSERGNTTSLSSNMVWAFHEDKNGNLWLGTKGGGLNMLSRRNRASETYKFEHFSENIALPSSNIYGIKSDNNGNIWISHNKGVSKIDPKLNLARHYGTTDGLQDKEFNMGASYQSQSGEIYFGGNHGFNVIRPWELPETEEIPLVHISEIKVMNQRLQSEMPYDSLKSINLDHTDRILSIEFFASDYTNPSLNKYAYKLEGIDENWIISNEARHVSFTTLPAGSYTLRLGAANPSGIWNWNGKSITINVAPPPWRSPAAFLVYTLFVILTLSLLYLKSIRDKRAVALRQLELEKKVRERTIDLEEARKTAEQANSAKSQFLATVSHEIRTPMHGMLGMTDLLLRTDLTEQQKSYAETAKSNGESLLSIINDILDFSKIESGHMEIECIEFNPINLLEECCYLYAEAANRKSLTLAHTISADVPELALGDPGKVRQITNNLLNNAIKFTNEGSVTLSAIIVESGTNRDQIDIQICIADTGIGMDTEAKSRAFQPFTQADSSTTRKYGGTGLGLSICRDLAELMKGQIEILSQKGTGTRVCFTIPLIIKSNKTTKKPQEQPTALYQAYLISSDSSLFAMLQPQFERLDISLTMIGSFSGVDAKKCIVCIDENFIPVDSKVIPERQYLHAILITSSRDCAPRPTLPHARVLSRPTTTKALEHTIKKLTKPLKWEHQNTLETSPERRIKILVAEDIETNQAIVRSIAKILDYELTIVSDGLKAIDSWISNDYDIIFMDCQMPILDGFSATKKIREIEGEKNTSTKNRTPIIAITAGTAEEERNACLDAGMDGFLGKPFVVDQFQEIVENFLGTKRNFRIATTDESQNKTRHNNIEETTFDVDLSAISRIKALDPDGTGNLLRKVIETFNSQALEILSSLDGQDDTDEIRRYAHALKSMALNVGAKKIAHLSGTLEKESKLHKIVDLDVRLSEMRSGIVNYMNEIQAHLN